MGVERRRVDTAWFKETIKSSKFGTAKALADAMFWDNGRPYDQARLSRIINGADPLKLQLFEALQLAELLEISFLEILKRAGVRVPETPAERAFRKKAEAQGLSVEGLMRKVAGR